VKTSFKSSFIDVYLNLAFVAVLNIFNVLYSFHNTVSIRFIALEARFYLESSYYEFGLGARKSLARIPVYHIYSQ